MKVSWSLRRYAFVGVIRELMRSDHVPNDLKRRASTFALIIGAIVGPVAVGTYLRWVLTGRRMLGRLGRAFPPRGLTNAVYVNPFRGPLPVDIREVLAQVHRSQDT